MLDNVISIVLPSINPDGTQMIADWYMKHVGTPARGRRAAVAVPEVRGPRQQPRRLRAEPARVAASRQADVPRVDSAGVRRSSPDGQRQRAPLHPAVRRADSPDGDPLVWREMAWWGAHMGNRLEAAGKTGVIGAAIYSGWGHMGFHWITPFHNIAGMLTESASARLATPMFMHPDQLRGGPRDLPEYESQTTMPSLWPGGWWRVRDIVEQQKIAAWATVDLAARNRETVLWNMYLKGTRQTERGAKGPVKAYAIAAAQHDPLTGKKLVNMLLDSGVEVHQAKAQFFVDGRVYGPGSFVVSMAQPKQGLVRWMLGRTFYPDNSYTRERDGKPIRPYDMATDTFGEFMGVRSDPVSEAVTADLVKLTAHVPLVGTVARAARRNGYVLERQLNDSYRAVILLLDKGVAVRRVCAAPTVLRRATFIVRALGARCSPRSRSRRAWTSPRSPAPARRRLRDPEAAHRDVPALRRRQHGRGLDAADVRAVQRAVQVAHGRRDQEGRPGGEVRRDRPAGGFGAGDDRRAPAGGGGAPVAAVAAARWSWRARQHAARISQRLRRRRRKGAAGVRREGRHARHVRRRPAICRFSASACRCATSSPGLPSKEFWSPGIDAARALRQRRTRSRTACQPRASRCSWRAARCTK